MGTDVLGANKGGSRCPELGEDLRGVGSGGNDLQVVDVGNYMAHWEGFGRIPPQCGPQSDGEATLERAGRCMGLPPSGGCDDGGGMTGGGYLCLSPPEHIKKVHYDQAHYGPVSSGGAHAGSRVANRWWEKDSLNLEGMRTADWEAEWTEREEETDRTEKEMDTD